MSQACGLAPQGSAPWTPQPPGWQRNTLYHRASREVLLPPEQKIPSNSRGKYPDGDDPIAVLRSTLEEVPRLIQGVAEEDLNRQPAPGEWSPRQVLSHLADSDMIFGVRMRMIVTQDRPTLVGYNQDAWTARFSGLDQTARDTLDRWQVLRKSNLRMFESLTDVGLHTERGEESVRLNLRLLAGHDRAHLEQFRRGLQHS